MEPGNIIGSTEDLRQGDVVRLSWIPSVIDGEPAATLTPDGVVIVSQTCDVVQNSKTHCLVAPIVPSTDEELSQARKGQSPLRLYLPSAAGVDAEIADLQQTASVPKGLFVGAEFIARRTIDEQDDQARNIADRLGRLFTRFPFPDEVYPAFNKLRKRVQKTAGGQGWFGQVLEYVDDLRVSADQWATDGRNLTLHIVVSAQFLIPEEEADLGWDWSRSIVHDRRPGEMFSTLSLDRISELLVKNLQQRDHGEYPTDPTTILRLWQSWSEATAKTYLGPSAPAVSSFVAVLASDVEFTWADWKLTESLDLEVLSDSKAS